MSDDFLTKLYEEEKTKVASAELEAFMRGMGRDDLEAFLGLDKLAVAGPAEPELPTSASASEIEASHQAKKTYVEQEHAGNPKGVTKQPERAQTSDSQSRDSKAKTDKEDEPKTKSAEAKLLWADKIGRMFAKEAAEKGSCAGMEKNEDFTNPVAKAKAKAFAATMKASKGKPLAARKNALQNTEAAIEKKAQEGEPVTPESWLAGQRGMARAMSRSGEGGMISMADPALIKQRMKGMGKGFGLGALGGSALGAGAGLLAGKLMPGSGAATRAGIGALGGGMLGGAVGTQVGAGRADRAWLAERGITPTMGGFGRGKFTQEAAEKYLKPKKGKEKASQGMGEEMGDGMETTASVKAKIAARAMKVSEGAPEHIKAAAVFMAGREISKLGGKMSLERREGLSSGSFAIPTKKAKSLGVKGEIKGESKGKYPIPDMKHARNALARVSQKGTPGEREAVRKKVYSKFPGLKEGFEESHGGASPTSKENVKKVTQGAIKQGAALLKEAIQNPFGEAAMKERIQRRQKALESKPRQMIGGGVGGGVLGGMAGHALGGTKGAIIGSLLGAGAGTGLGAAAARGGRIRREAMQEMPSTQ